MDFTTRTKGLHIDQSVRAYLDERLEHALGRFRHLVGGIDVRLSDENGPRGVVEETRADPFTAIAHAMDRIRTGMRKRANRRAHRHRGRE